LLQLAQTCRRFARRRRRHSRCRIALSVVIGHLPALGLAKMAESLVSRIPNARRERFFGFSRHKPTTPPAIGRLANLPPAGGFARVRPGNPARTALTPPDPALPPSNRALFRLFCIASLAICSRGNETDQRGHLMMHGFLRCPPRLEQAVFGLNRGEIPESGRF
jgi:hypothetical protein